MSTSSRSWLLAVFLSLSANLPLPVALGQPAERADRPGTPLPPAAIVRLVTVGPAARGETRAIAFSSDGKLLAVCGGDDRVRLWETATGKEIASETKNRGFS